MEAPRRVFFATEDSPIPQFPQVEVFDVRAAHKNCSTVGVVEPLDELDHRGFAASRRPHKGDGLTLVYRQGEAVQDL